MKGNWWLCGLVVLLAVGCDKAIQDVQKAAEDSRNQAAADAKARLDEETAQAIAKVNQAAEEKKAEIAGATEEAKATLEGAFGDLSALKIGDVDLSKEAGSIADTLSTTLDEIKDVDSAKAALPKLEEVNLGLDKLVGLVDQIPETIRPALASAFKTHRAKLQETIEKVVAIEGVGEIVKPVLDQIVAKLDKVGGGEAAAKPEPAP
jgi:hypothetical protein